MRPAAAILFDFDGVLARTMEDNFRAWQRAFAEYGVRLEPEDYFLQEGMELTRLARLLCHSYGINPKNAGDIVKQKEAHYRMRHHFGFYPGVVILLRRLRRHRVPMAIVSAARRARLEETASAAFLRQFGAVVTGEKTKRGKPFPDPYRAAARELGVDIRRCVVVENAPLGITAAKRAGAYCIAISSTLERSHLSHADLVVKEFRDLIKVPRIDSLLGLPSRVVARGLR